MPSFRGDRRSRAAQGALGLRVLVLGLLTLVGLDLLRIKADLEPRSGRPLDPSTLNTVDEGGGLGTSAADRAAPRTAAEGRAAELPCSMCSHLPLAGRQVHGDPRPHSVAARRVTSGARPPPPSAGRVDAPAAAGRASGSAGRALDVTTSSCTSSEAGGGGSHPGPSRTRARRAAPRSARQPGSSIRAGEGGPARARRRPSRRCGRCLRGPRRTRPVPDPRGQQRRDGRRGGASHHRGRAHRRRRVDRRRASSSARTRRPAASRRAVAAATGTRSMSPGSTPTSSSTTSAMSPDFATMWPASLEKSPTENGIGPVDGVIFVDTAGSPGRLLQIIGPVTVDGTTYDGDTSWATSTRSPARSTTAGRRRRCPRRGPPTSRDRGARRCSTRSPRATCLPSRWRRRGWRAARPEPPHAHLVEGSRGGPRGAVPEPAQRRAPSRTGSWSLHRTIGADELDFYLPADRLDSTWTVYSDDRASIRMTITSPAGVAGPNARRTSTSARRTRAPTEYGSFLAVYLPSVVHDAENLALPVLTRLPATVPSRPPVRVRRIPRGQTQVTRRRFSLPLSLDALTSWSSRACHRSSTT